MRFLTPAPSITQLNRNPPKPRLSTSSSCSGRVRSNERPVRTTIPGIPSHAASRQSRIRLFGRSQSEVDTISPSILRRPPTPERYSISLLHQRKHQSTPSEGKIESLCSSRSHKNFPSSKQNRDIPTFRNERTFNLPTQGNLLTHGVCRR